MACVVVVVVHKHNRSECIAVSNSRFKQMSTLFEGASSGPRPLAFALACIVACRGTLEAGGCIVSIVRCLFRPTSLE